MLRVINSALDRFAPRGLNTFTDFDNIAFAFRPVPNHEQLADDGDWLSPPTNVHDVDAGICIGKTRSCTMIGSSYNDERHCCLLSSNRSPTCWYHWVPHSGDQRRRGELMARAKISKRAHFIENSFVARVRAVAIVTWSHCTSVTACL